MSQVYGAVMRLICASKIDRALLWKPEKGNA